MTLRGLSSLAHTQTYDGSIPSPATAGWSSQVARQAHNLKVVSSNLTPATLHFRIV